MIGAGTAPGRLAGGGSVPAPRRLVVGIGELAVSNDRDELIVTHALGSCIAVCIFDPVVGVAAMLHFLLPDSRINADRARQRFVPVHALGRLGHRGARFRQRGEVGPREDRNR